MKQLGPGLNLSTKKTRKREFLEDMERVVPWSVLVQIYLGENNAMNCAAKRKISR